MNQQQMHKLLAVPERTLRDWKKGNRAKLYKLLETLDYDVAQQLLTTHNSMDMKKLLENESYYQTLRDFERDLYALLVSGRENKKWLELSKDTTLSKEARARAAYLYSFLSNKITKLGFKQKVDVGLYHGNKTKTGNGLAKVYGLRNGIDIQRFNQYKTTGRF